MSDWISLKELDAEAGLPKGSAFRAFKAAAESWGEHTDYRVLHHEADRAEIDALRAQGRIYNSTVNLVLLSPAMAAALRAQLRRITTDPAE